MRNSELRELMRKKGVRQWQVAEELQIGEFTLIRWLRRDLTEKRRNEILAAIQHVEQTKEGEKI